MPNQLVTNHARLIRGVVLTAILTLGRIVHAAEPVTPPEEALGFELGADHHLANFTQLEAYWKTLSEESPRMRLARIGTTSWGRAHWMAVITAPQNFAKLDEYRAISRKMALAEGVGEDQARRYAATGKAVVLIQGGLHATEVVSAQQLLRLSYELVSKNDEETLRFLDDAIILLVLANPDGMELVADWYMRESEPHRRSTAGLPLLYQRYVGHDNNRDAYMNSQLETQNISRVLYHEWFPQIFYDHHQPGPAGQIVFLHPMREPYNPNYSSIVMLGNQALGLAVHQRLVAEGKGGSAMRELSRFSDWFNGNYRITGYFHNQIGILSEIKGHPNPMTLPFFPDQQLRTGSYPLPYIPGTWRLRDALEYSISMNRAVLDYASRNRSTLLYNRYAMGRDAIEAGNRDSWTIRPSAVAALERELRSDPEESKKLARRAQRNGVDKKYLERLRTADNRDPRGYVIPSDQKDFPTAVKFLNALISTGIVVQRSSEEFMVGGKRYPAGSYIVKAAQAFRGHVLDMFEPQDHPNDVEYEGGPPKPPYDGAGYTLAFQMGIEFDRILEALDGPFEKVEGRAKPLPGKVNQVANAVGYVLSHDVNDSAIAVNRLLAGGHNVYWLQQENILGGKRYPPGTLYVEARHDSVTALAGHAEELGLSIDAVSAPPAGNALRLRRSRLGVWDRYGGSIRSGWAQYILAEFEFPFELVYPQGLDEGDLRRKYDALLFVDGSIPRPGVTPDRDQPSPRSIPPEFRHRLGFVTERTTIPKLRQFATAGGSIIAIGSATNIVQHFDIPVRNHMAGADGKQLARSDFYVPMSILEARVDTRDPLAYGIDDTIDVMFDQSPVFRIDGDTARGRVREISRFERDRPLRSGWALGQEKLRGGAAIFAADVGDGTVFAFGPDILFRSQSHGTFQFLFNSIYLSTAEQVRFGSTGE